MNDDLYNILKVFKDNYLNTNDNEYYLLSVYAQLAQLGRAFVL